MGSLEYDDGWNDGCPRKACGGRRFPEGRMGKGTDGTEHSVPLRTADCPE